MTKLLTRLVRAGRGAAFVFLSAAVVGVGSERMFWYWSPAPLDHAIVALVYSPAIGTAIWAVDRYRVDTVRALLLAAPLFAYYVEGVITPILYSGGPFVPFFPVWFTAWHGILAFVLLWYAVRRWLVAGRWRPLLVTSTLLGLFWGAWSITLTLPENVEDEELIADQGGPLQVLDPTDFAVYTATFTLILAAAHYLLGRGLWAPSFEPPRWLRWSFALATAAVLVAWTVAIPWAAPMFLAYGGLQVWALRRHRARAAGPSILHQLQGRVRLRTLLPLVPMPLLATATYTALWEAELPESLIREAFFYGTIAVQTLIAAGLMGWSLFRAFRPSPAPSSERPGPGPEPQPSGIGIDHYRPDPFVR